MTKNSEVAPFEFLSPLDGNTYTLPPYDPEKFVDEFKNHPDFIPKVTFSDALLADDPQVGLDLLDKPRQAVNVLVTRGIVKTLQNHVADDDPAWAALKALMDAAEFDVLAKVFTEWRAMTEGAEGVESPGEA